MNARLLRLTIQQEIFLFSSLMLVTCCFLPWYGTPGHEGGPYDWFSTQASPFPVALVVGLFAFAATVPLTVNAPRLRPWVTIVAVSELSAVLSLIALMPGGLAYGGRLAQFFALVALFVSARPALLAAGDFAMRKLNSQKAEMFTHWGTTLPMHFSANEFYEKLETKIRDREWPGVEFLRILHTEAGLLSHKREYLRIVRQRQVIDVCAATFGKDYFFSMREAEIRAELTFMTFLIFLACLGLLFNWLTGLFGSFSGLIGFGALLVFGVFLLMNVLRMGLTRLDGILLRVPVIGPIYETWFRRNGTYFQHDTRMVFLKLIDDMVKEHVDEETSAKGIQLLPCFEHQPILDDLYKTSMRTLRKKEAAPNGAA
jgi:hypothetical protein